MAFSRAGWFAALVLSASMWGGAGAYATTAPGAAYCTQTGGTVVMRAAARDGTTSGSRVLGGAAGFCQYTRHIDGSRIGVLLDTLYSTKPTLAVLAYRAKTKPGACRANPASCYCAVLGGIENPGGWVADGKPDDVLETCVFADRSAIDSFGLFYHSAGIIRGTDLTHVLRFRG